MKLLTPLDLECTICIWHLCEDKSMNEVGQILLDEGFEGATLAQVMHSKKNIELSGALREIKNDGLCDLVCITQATKAYVFADNSAIIEGNTSFTLAQFD